MIKWPRYIALKVNAHARNDQPYYQVGELLFDDPCYTIASPPSGLNEYNHPDHFTNVINKAERWNRILNGNS